MTGGILTLVVVAAVAVLGFRGHGAEPVIPCPQARASTAGDLDTLLRAADPLKGERLFGRCRACHSIGRAAVDLDGPNLYGVVGRRIAERRPRFAYTNALRHLGGVWTPARLDAWLACPEAVAPGTKMVFEGLSDARDRADIIAYLNTQGSGVPLP